jgi:hypothetical protein
MNTKAHKILEILGTSENGYPLSVARLEKDIEEAEADIRAGRVYTTTQVKSLLKLSNMSLQARKLSIIDWVLHLHDEDSIKQLEKIYSKYSYIHPPAISNEEMYARHTKSLKQIEKGKVVSHADAKKRFGL